MSFTVFLSITDFLKVKMVGLLFTVVVITPLIFASIIAHYSLPPELLPLPVYDPSLNVEPVFDHPFTLYDVRLLKQIKLFMELENTYRNDLNITFRDPGQLFITGNTKYPAIDIGTFSFRTYLGDYRIYDVTASCDRGNFSGHVYNHWYWEYQDRVFSRSKVIGVDATFDPYLTVESNSQLFSAVKEWYTTWAPGSNNEIYQLFARFFVPFGQDLNNPAAFIDGEFKYAFSLPNMVHTYNSEYSNLYRSYSYCDSDFTEFWPYSPHHHPLFRDFIRIATGDVNRTELPTSLSEINQLKNVMEIFLNIYYKNQIIQNGSAHNYAHLISVEYVPHYKPWGSPKPSFLTFVQLGLMRGKEVCWV